MEFLKSCNTNAQAIVCIIEIQTRFVCACVDSSQGDYPQVAYQAFAITRDPSSTSKTFDWNSSDDLRAVEAQLRREKHLVVQDASRPWLWWFRSALVEHPSQITAELPAVDGYKFHRTFPALDTFRETNLVQVNSSVL
jgi:mediator of RNA polymerase II transcription subunit 13